MEATISHTSVVKAVAIKDVEALKRTVEDLGKLGINCRLEENARPRMYYNHQEVMCDFVLRLDEAKCQYSGKPYDVGFEKQKDGSYLPIFDVYGGGIAKVLGHDVEAKGIDEAERTKRHLSKLLQHYSANAAVNAARKAGYSLASKRTAKDGTIQLRIAV